MTINQKIIDGRLVEFFGRFSEIKYAKKEYILRAEDEPQGIYFLKSGFVKQVFLTESGKCLTLNIFKPGTYFPLTWALGGVENHDFFEAMTAVVTYRAPNDQVLAWLKQEPELLYTLTRRLSTGLGGMVHRMESLFYIDAKSRIASVLVMLGKRFGLKQPDGQVEISLTMTHQEIADLAGLTRETASTELKKLNDQGVLGYGSKKLVIKDWGKLQRRAGG